jgi:hypothetical protein
MRPSSSSSSSSSSPSPSPASPSSPSSSSSSSCSWMAATTYDFFFLVEAGVGSSVASSVALAGTSAIGVGGADVEPWILAWWWLVPRAGAEWWWWLA